MKQSLTNVSAKAEEESKQRPSLIAPEQNCPPFAKLLYEPAKPIEAICSTPQTAPAAKNVGK